MVCRRVQSHAEAEAGDAGEEVREAEAEAEAGVSAGEALRRQRSAEARRLIGASTAAARALFQQNLAQGQMSTR